MKRTFVVLLLLTLLFIVHAKNIKDVSPLLPEYNAVEFVVKNKIMDLKNGFFEGEKVVTKFDLAVYIYNFVKYLSVSHVLNATEEKYDIGKILKYDPSSKDFGRILNIERKLQYIMDITNSIEGKLNEIEKRAHPPATPTESKELKKIEKRCENLAKAFSNFSDRIVGIENLLKSLEATTTNMASNLKLLEESNDLILKDIYSLKEDVTTLKKEYVVLNSKVESVVTTGIVARLKEFNARIESMEKRVSALESKKALSKTEHSYLTKDEFMDILENNNLKIEKDYKSKFEVLKEEIRSLKGEMENYKILEKRVEALEKNVDQYEKEKGTYNIIIIAAASVSLISLIISIFAILR